MASIFLRIGLAFAFFYAAIASYFDPNSWIGFFPEFLRSTFPESLLLSGFSAFEIVLGFWILSGRLQFLAGLVAAFVLAGIVVFNTSQMDIVFRDVSLMFAALALAVMSRKM